MTTEISYEPTSPSAGDALTFTVTGTAPEGSRVVVTADGDEMQASPPFGLEAAPEGTGNDQYTLKITGGSIGTFILGVYEYGDDPAETDPIYYFNDAPTYAYPDSDDIIDALEEALPGLDVEVERDGATLTVILGGKYAGKDMQMTVTPTITGSETAVNLDRANTAAEFTWGPVVLPADVYTVDVVDADDDSLLDDEVTITIT
jgi:hypothetical protein